MRGEYDHLPEAAFYMVGGIEEVVEKAEKMSKDNKKLMEKNFAVEIISPDRTVFKSNTVEVIIPSFEGEMGILKNHVSLITFLRPGIITINKEKEKKNFLLKMGQ